MSTDLQTISLGDISVVEGHNPRGAIDADTLQPLADSIAAHGVTGQPRQIHTLAGEIFEAKLAKATVA